MSDAPSPRDLPGRYGLPPAAAERLAAAWEALEQPPEAAQAVTTLLQRCCDASVPLDWAEVPHAPEALLRMAYAAPFLLRHLGMRPQVLAEGLLADLETGPVRPSWPHAGEAEALAALEETEWMRRLRLWRYDSYVRLTARALLGLDGPAETCRTVADLADDLVRLAFRWCFATTVRSRGLPLRADGALAGAGVVGMGKLGGRELNYASDIDLVFMQDGDDTPCRRLAEPPPVPVTPDAAEASFWDAWEAAVSDAGEPARDSSGEFYNRMARQVVRVLSHQTAEGFAFRVDADLRPNGRAGMLAPHMAFLARYYEQQGREWERTAMIKARVITGPAPLAEEFRELVRPFVYRRYLDYSALEGVAIVKHDIDRNSRDEEGRNIKLGRGGIRENEFIVQALQLLYGGRRPELQATGHAEALERISAAGILPAEECESILADYWCLRAVENRVQMLDEAQTHELPEPGERRTRVLHDFAPAFAARQEAAEAALQAARERTERRFNELFEGLGEGELTGAEAWREAVCAHLPAEEHAEAMARADHLFSRLMSTRIGERCVFKLTHLLTQDALYRQGTEPAFWRWLAFFEQIGNRNALYALMASQPSVLDWVSLILSEGGRHAEPLIRHPEFLESFVALSGQQEADLAGEMAAVEEGARDEEEFILDLHSTKAQNLLRILTAYLNEPGSQAHQRRLSDLADAVVGACLRFAWRQLVARLGEPAGATPEAPAGFAVLALGKLGSRELRFSSDLDLVFVYEQDGTTSAGRSHYEFYTKLAQRLGNLLTAQTQFGRLYDLDHRLRPFGSKGVLVPSLSGFKSFLAEDTVGGAEVWNFQALTRIRPVCGDRALGGALMGAIGEAWQARAPAPADIAAAVREMLGRLTAQHAPQGAPALPLKYAAGGMLGYEFATQAHFLCARAEPGADWTPPPPHEKIEPLEPAYRELSALDERLSFYVDGFDHALRPEHPQRFRAVAERWGYEQVEGLCRQLEAGVASAFDALGG